jgi:multiple sugar transport system permease protein
MTTGSAIEYGGPAVRRQSLWRYWRGGLRGSEFTWALAFLVPYIGVFFAFVIYPVGYGLWMGSKPSLYTEVFSDPIYQQTLVNTMLFVAPNPAFSSLPVVGLFYAPGLVGQRAADDLRAAVGGVGDPSFISIHWMLNGEWGLINNFLWIVFGAEGRPGSIRAGSRWVQPSTPMFGSGCRSGPLSCLPAGCRSRRRFMTRPKWMAPPGCAGSPM